MSMHGTLPLKPTSSFVGPSDARTTAILAGARTVQQSLRDVRESPVVTRTRERQRIRSRLQQALQANAAGDDARRDWLLDDVRGMTNGGETDGADDRGGPQGAN